jgi:hypothetical protein
MTRPSLTLLSITPDAFNVFLASSHCGNSLADACSVLTGGVNPPARGALRTPLSYYGTHRPVTMKKRQICWFRICSWRSVRYAVRKRSCSWGTSRCASIVMALARKNGNVECWNRNRRRPMKIPNVRRKERLGTDLRHAAWPAKEDVDCSRRRTDEVRMRLTRARVSLCPWHVSCARLRTDE